MAYGDYNGPDKPNKGHEGGACNRRDCQAEPALWWNHGSHSWYCDDCADQIGNDVVNYRGWMLNHYPTLGHPMFETRAEMVARNPDLEVINTDEVEIIDPSTVGFSDRAHRRRAEKASRKELKQLNALAYGAGRARGIKVDPRIMEGKLK